MELLVDITSIQWQDQELILNVRPHAIIPKIVSSFNSMNFQPENIVTFLKQKILKDANKIASLALEFALKSNSDSEI